MSTIDLHRPLTSQLKFGKSRVNKKGEKIRGKAFVEVTIDRADGLAINLDGRVPALAFAKALEELIKRNLKAGRDATGATLPMIQGKTLQRRLYRKRQMERGDFTGERMKDNGKPRDDLRRHYKLRGRGMFKPGTGTRYLDDSGLMRESIIARPKGKFGKDDGGAIINVARNRENALISIEKRKGVPILSVPDTAQSKELDAALGKWINAAIGDNAGSIARSLADMFAGGLEKLTEASEAGDE